MLQPKRVKYRKMFKGKVKGVAQRGAELSFGSFGLKRWKVVGLLIDKLNQQGLQLLEV